MAYVALALLGLTLLLGSIVWKLRKANATLREKRQAIVVEEHRMFSFLHGLGAALQTSRTQEELYQYILNGALRVIEGSQGALFLLDKKGKSLVPRALSDHCPPLIASLLADYDPAMPKQQRSARLLRAVPLTDADALLVDCMKTRNGMHLENLGSHAAFQQASSEDQAKLPHRAMLAPLHFGQHDLGVIIVLNEGTAAPFDANDFAVFRSLADQSSLALGTDQLSRKALAQRRLEEELLNAREVQRILLPDKAPPLDGFRIAARNQAARSVSGDYYDFIPLGKHALGVAIADVSGKGLPASLTMVMGRSVLRANTESWQSPAEALAMVNRILHPDMRTDMFVSMIYLIAKSGSGKITLARAGHDPALLYRAATQSIEEIAPPGLAVGVDAGRIFERDTHDHSLEMLPGDVLLLYTDGITEAENAMGDEFGIDLLQETFLESAPLGAEQILNDIHEKVAAFVAESQQTDDMTMVVLEKT